MFKNVRVLARFRQNSKLILDLKNRDLVFNSRLLLSALQRLFGLVIQCPSYPTEERARSVTRPNKGCCHSSVRKKAVNKTRFNSKNDTKNYLLTFLIPINLDLNRRGSREGHKPLHLPNEPKMFSGCHSLCMAPFLHEIISKKAILQPCNWYKISKCCDMRCPRLKTLMQQSDW